VEADEVNRKSVDPLQKQGECDHCTGQDTLFIPESFSVISSNCIEIYLPFSDQRESMCTHEDTMAKDPVIQKERPFSDRFGEV